MGFQIGSVNKKFNAEQETFLNQFTLRHEGDPLFKKEFVGDSTTDILLGDDSIVIPNHFYRTGEELVYDSHPNVDFTGSTFPIGIQHGQNGTGAGTTLPKSVFAIKVDENKIRLAATKALALQNSPIGLTTVGVGATHAFTAKKLNTKCIILIDNIVQSPVYPRQNTTASLVSISNNTLVLDDASMFEAGSLIKINDEIMVVEVTNSGGNANTLLVKRSWLGTRLQTHTAGDTAMLVFGDYNIIGDKITFVDVPFGGNRRQVGINSSNIVGLGTDHNFTILTESLETGSAVKLRSLTPPSPLVSNREYYIIQSEPNTFKFADTKDDAVTNQPIALTSAGIGTHTLVFADDIVGSSFQGRAFTRSDYDGNVVMDDVAQNFTGIGKTFTLTSGGSNTVGITSDFGAILINNIFQKPSEDYTFIGGSTTGITSVRFTGTQTPGGVDVLSTVDVNANKLPRKGIIVSIGNSQGFGYEPGLYDDVKLESANTGVGASISVEIGIGKSLGEFTITNPGYGYTVGETLNVVGIPTVSSIGANFQNAIFTVEDTADDEFAGWVFGKLQILDDISDQFNGRKTTFQLKNNNVVLSIEKQEGSPISLDDVLLIFINDVLQKPGVAYNFSGGTRIEFTEPPVAGSSCQILFYRGTDSDIDTASALESIKKGDGVKIIDQDSRVARDILTRDTLLTTNYKGPGITDVVDPLRPLRWTKQRDDLFVEGVKVSKSRAELAGNVFPSSRAIKSIASSDSVIYMQGGALGFRFSEGNTFNPTSDFPIRIVDTARPTTGFGLTTYQTPVVSIESANIAGDQGTICGVGVSAQALQLHLHIPLNAQARVNKYGGISKTGIGTGDYFVISRSNVGTGVTALTQDRTGTVGIATEFLDGVYEVSHIEDLASQVVRVHVNIQTNHGLAPGFVGLSSDVGNNYGTFSWAKVTCGNIGTSFAVNSTEGLVGLSTAPEVVRTSRLLLDLP
jgi:hypothetical protein|tara:strand:+ start:13446 stop:16343 length:2898 start_codon:yes stop_codon:yes gene_type:complete